MTSNDHLIDGKNSIATAIHWAKSLDLETIDAELLMLHVIGSTHQRGRAWLRTHLSDQLSGTSICAYQELCRLRLDGYPLAYLTGSSEFYGLKLRIDQRVLDPRPDTESLVDWALETIQLQPRPVVADLGTGSGAIALAIKHHHPAAYVLAIDECRQALALAQQNAHQLRLEINFRQGNWLEPLRPNLCHLIVSNPPYISANDPHLPALRHEPLKALTSGQDGLDDIRHLIEQAPDFLVEDGHLLLEHGFDQAAAVQSLFLERGFIDITSRNDLHGHARCTGGKWPSLKGTR